MVLLSQRTMAMGRVALLVLVLAGYAGPGLADAFAVSATDIPLLSAAIGPHGIGPSGAGSTANESAPGRYGQQDPSTPTATPTATSTPVPTTESDTMITIAPTPGTSAPPTSAIVEQADGSGGQGNRPETTPGGDGSAIIALVAGLMLAVIVGLVDYRQNNGQIDNLIWQAGGLVFFAIVAIALFSMLVLAGIPGRGMAILGAFALAGAVGGTAMVLAAMFYRRVWFRITLWFHALGSSACAVILPALAIASGSPATQALPYAILFVVSLVGAVFFVAKIPPGSAETEARNATVVGGSPVDPSLVPAAMSDLYTGVTPIATGGLAKVYRAVRRQDGATVAVKVPLNADQATGASFMKEMLLWRNLRHPNIVSVTGVGILPFPYVEMEYLERSLADIPKPVDLDTAIQYIRGIAEGLAYAHAKGIIHRDIKPENILIAPDGTPKISDWGMSRDVAARDLPTVAGFSLSYAAPEQLAPSQYQGTDQRTDIFQMGIVFYELVTGRLPFPGDGIGEVSTAILTKSPVRPSALVPESRSVEPIICRCLRKDPTQRYQSVNELSTALSEVGSPM